MGGWAAAHLRSKLSYNKKHTRNEKRPILGTTITISRLKKRGYVAMLEVSFAAAFGGHLSLNPSRYEPPYTRPVSRSFGSGVRSERCCTDASAGALRQFIWRSRLLDCVQFFYIPFLLFQLLIVVGCSLSIG